MEENYRSKEVAMKFKEAAELINTGIVYKGAVRKFDIIDLYLIVGDAAQSINNYLSICLRNKLISRSVFDSIKILINHYAENTLKISYSSLRNMRYIYGDREITLEEKDMIYDYMHKNGIPYSDVNFNVAVRHYALYGLDIGMPKKKRRTRKIDK